MAEYIEREAMKAEIMKHYSSEYPAALVLAIIDNQPAADVAEVMHDKWQGFITHAYIGCDEYGNPKWAERRFFVHRKCGRRTAIKEKYCPNCGAKMDLGDDEE